MNNEGMNDLLINEEGMAELFKVAVETIRTWKKRGQIPEECIFKLPGTKKGTTRFIKAKVEDWIYGRLSA